MLFTDGALVKFVLKMGVGAVLLRLFNMALVACVRCVLFIDVKLEGEVFCAVLVALKTRS